MPEELNMNLAEFEPQIAPIYDSVGNILRYEVVSGTDRPESFSHVQLVQDWYYDHKRNRVFVQNKEMIIFIRKPASPGYKEPVPVFKLVFK